MLSFTTNVSAQHAMEVKQKLRLNLVVIAGYDKP